MSSFKWFLNIENEKREKINKNHLKNDT